MKSTLIIKDLALDKELGGKAMSAVRGGFGSQDIKTSQENTVGVTANVNLANGAAFLNSGDVKFDVVSAPSVYASNYSDSSNSMEWKKGFSSHLRGLC
jgi:hypothetical protein